MRVGKKIGGRVTVVDAEILEPKELQRRRLITWAAAKIKNPAASWQAPGYFRHKLAGVPLC